MNSPFVDSEREVLAEFQAACEAEAEQPGQHWERVKQPTLDLGQMWDRQSRVVQIKMK